FKIRGCALVPEVAAQKVKLICFGVFGRVTRECILFRARKLGSQSLSHFSSDLTLHREDVGQFAIVTLRPKMRRGRRVDQLHADADVIGRFCTLPSKTWATPSCLPISRMSSPELL